MLTENKILIGKGENPVYLLPQMANRHGLIAGATGTGKTYTLKVLAEGFSSIGVPVFLADIKGDVSSLALAGEKNEKILSRLESIGLNEDQYTPTGFPCCFWDVFAKNGVPVRATISDVGPMLLSRLMGLTEVQSGVLNIVFHVADDNGWELIDLKDLQAMLVYVSEHKSELTTSYGNVSTASIGVIQRALLNLKDQGAEAFFGEPALKISDWIRQSADGRGMINILHCVELAQQPLLYATVMLWMLSELYELLPEVGDLDKPRVVFFFDEAHMLFHDAPKALTDKVVQVVKLIRSKGVGIYFISQSPADIPDPVLAQLNNRIQHALHAYTPAEQKAVRTAAQNFRVNPAFRTEDVISSMGTGIALVSTLDEYGAPTVVEQAVICPPQSGSRPMDMAARAMLVVNDEVYPFYKDSVDEVSAYEILTGAREQAAVEKQAELDAQEAEKQAQLEAKEAEKLAQLEAKEAEKLDKEAQKQALLLEREEKAAQRQAELEAKAAEREEKEKQKELQAKYKAEGRDRYGRTKLQASIEKAAKSSARSVGRNVGKSITRGVLGTSNNTLNKVAGQMAGNLMSDLFGSFFR